MNTTRTKLPWLYLLLAYGLAWIFWIPVAITGQDYQASPLLLVLVLIGVFGPGLAGIVLTYVEGGRTAGRDFWRRMFDFRRIRPVWYLVILSLWPALHLLSILFSRLSGEVLPASALLQEIAAQPLSLLAILLLYTLQAGLEELGWRGYMLERLQKSMGLAKSSLVIGLFHTLWHLPLFWMVGTNQIKMGFGLDFVFYVIFVFATAVYSTWCYMDNGHSTLAVTLLHTMGNLSIDIFAADPQTLKYRFNVIFMAIGALFLLTYWIKRGNRGENA